MERLENLYEEMVEIRRDLHMYPELSFEEVRTPEIIANYLSDLGLEVKTGVGGRGVVATLRGNKPGKTVALRADFDALPIQEKNQVPYKSTVPGVMHACGHDAHTAIVLAIAKALSENTEVLEGNVVFIHQHAEEQVPGGAIKMIEDGCLDGVDAIFAPHMENYHPVGSIAYRSGPIMAASDRFEIDIIGNGGHGAFPHHTKDSVVIGSQLVTNLQQVISREIDPLKEAVLSIGSFHSGEGYNVIAGEASIKGTVRTFDEDVRNSIEEKIKRIVEGTCHAAGASYKFQYKRGYPATINHEQETEILVESAKDLLKNEQIIEIPPNMGGEDFAYFLQKVPGSYVFFGSANPDIGAIHPYHHPEFDIDEQVMLYASKILTRTVVNYLQNYA
ncbi:M20 metallopeptidase family protein [Pontibacillus marinus]|nr:M20 family metallopeptidase [Pontibacillus marinus]